MKNIALSICMLLCCACSKDASDPPALRISDLSIGLMREVSQGEWRIYSPGDTFPLVPNGPCVVAEKAQNCMWYGFEFDYASNSAGQVLLCEAKFNKPTDMVNASRVESSDEADAKFEIELPRKEGHYSQSAYVFRNPDDAPTPWSADVSCNHNGKELIRFTFTALYVA